MKRRESGPGRGTQGRVADAGYPDDGGYPEDVYLDASAYPVDPGYRAHSGSRPRPPTLDGGASAVSRLRMPGTRDSSCEAAGRGVHEQVSVQEVLGESSGQRTRPADAWPCRGRRLRRR